MSKLYGTCEVCDVSLKPVWIAEDEYIIINGRRYKTGRRKKSCSHLECPRCLKNFCVDDSYDGPWQEINRG